MARRRGAPWTRGCHGHAERLIDQLEGALTNPIVLSDPFGDDPSGFIHDKDDRIGNTELTIPGLDTERCMMRFQVAIQEAQLRDHVASNIGEKWEANASGSREFAEYFRRIVADADQSDTAPLQFALDPLQLN